MAGQASGRPARFARRGHAIGPALRNAGLDCVWRRLAGSPARLRLQLPFGPGRPPVCLLMPTGAAKIHIHLDALELGLGGAKGGPSHVLLIKCAALAVGGPRRRLAAGRPGAPGPPDPPGRAAANRIRPAPPVDRRAPPPDWRLARAPMGFWRAPEAAGRRAQGPRRAR